MFTLFVFYVGIGLVSLLIALPLIFEMVKPNYFYGFRIRATLDDPAVWYAVNKYFAKRLFVVGITESISAVFLYFIPGITVDGYSLSVLAIFVVAFSIAMYQSMKYIKNLRTD
jgi:hypothetical protein